MREGAEQVPKTDQNFRVFRYTIYQMQCHVFTDPSQIKSDEPHVCRNSLAESQPVLDITPADFLISGSKGEELEYEGVGV